MDKAELVRTIRDASERMTELIAHTLDARLLEPVMDGWTRKDVVAHVAWWHDHSARVVESLRAAREPYDRNDRANTTDALNERTHREHMNDSPEQVRRAFDESAARLLAALEPLTDEDLFVADRWPWTDGEALAEMILWDSSRHYEAHREHLDPTART